MTDPHALQCLHEEIASGYATLVGLHRAMASLLGENETGRDHELQANLMEDMIQYYEEQATGLD